MTDVLIVSDWDSESFHRQVLELESRGYTARQETYRITPEMNPETGLITHLRSIEMRRPDKNGAGDVDSQRNAN